MDKNASPYPRAYVARVSEPKGSRLSATLVPRELGHLAIKVTFHRIPCPGLEVKLSELGADGKPGKSLGEPSKTDAYGRVSLGYLVPAGPYACEIEGQAPATVSTVHDPAAPFSVVLPVDRPYADLAEELEYDEVLRKIEDFELEKSKAEGRLEDGEVGGAFTVALAVSTLDAFDEEYPRFVLESDAGYRRELVAKADAFKADDGWLYVVFDGLDPEARYRFTRVHDEGTREVVFDGAPYEAIVDQPDEVNALLENHAYGEFLFDVGAKTKLADWG